MISKDFPCFRATWRMAKRILLIDYESHSAERARGSCASPDCEIVPAHDGEEALNTFSASRFDLVLLSGMLPRLPSAEVIREIRLPGAPPPSDPSDGLRLQAGSNTKADAQRVGAFDLLPRPFSDDALRRGNAAEALNGDRSGGQDAARRDGRPRSIVR